jgi:hydrogenase expression/formation protein HypE
MKGKNETISMRHGSGGSAMHHLIESLFLKYFGNNILNQQTDSAILSITSENIAFTTDSFVVDPIFFPGGDIGKLSVCGTVNDLSVSGAVPCYISVSFILEEGFPIRDLEKIVKSMAAEAAIAKVQIVTGDTKVVNKGKCDKIFINTAGIGILDKKNRSVGPGKNIRPGDRIIINGSIGDHGMAIMSARESFQFKVPVTSDCASLNSIIHRILDNSQGVKFMRDPTRGGVATVLNELAGKTGLGIEITESAVPVSRGVAGMCEILGFDPLYIANEGKVILVAGKKDYVKILGIMKEHRLGKESMVIGEIVTDHPGKVALKTITGGRRIVDLLTGDQLPRIC